MGPAMAGPFFMRLHLFINLGIVSKISILWGVLSF